MSERYSIESIGTKKHPCFYVNDAVSGDVAACRFSLAEAEQAKRELDLLEQPAQPFGTQPGEREYEVPADVLKRDRLLTLLAETTAAREKAAQEVAEWSKTLGECLAMERRLSDALRGSQPVAKPVQHLHGLGDKSMCGQPYRYLADEECAKCPECYKAWDDEVKQKVSFIGRMCVLRIEQGLSLLEAQQVARDEAHEEALTMNAKPSGVAAQPLRKLSPQDFDDRMAGYAARLRQYPGAY